MRSDAFTVLFGALVLGCGAKPPGGRPSARLSSSRLRPLAPGARWDSVDSKHFRFYTERGTYAAGHLATLRDRAERAWTDDLAMLGMRDYPHRIHIFYFESKERMDSVFDVPGEGPGLP
jgi:hypothetical protein